MSDGPIVPVVIDTNVLVPALYNHTPIAQYVIAGNILLIWNIYIYDEICRVINKLANRYRIKAGIEPEEVIALLDLIAYSGRKVSQMPHDWPQVSLDRKDDPFLWAAVIGGAEYVITDDAKHMLNLQFYKGIPIGRPGSFFRWVTKKYPMTS